MCEIYTYTVSQSCQIWLWWKLFNFHFHPHFIFNFCCCWVRKRFISFDSFCTFHCVLIQIIIIIHHHYVTMMMMMMLVWNKKCFHFCVCVCVCDSFIHLLILRMDNKSFCFVPLLRRMREIFRKHFLFFWKCYFQRIFLYLKEKVFKVFFDCKSLSLLAMIIMMF